MLDFLVVTVKKNKKKQMTVILIIRVIQPRAPRILFQCEPRRKAAAGPPSWTRRPGLVPLPLGAAKPTAGHLSFDAKLAIFVGWWEASVSPVP